MSDVWGDQSRRYLQQAWVTTLLHRRCISCFRGVIVRCIYAPLKLISANNEPGREVTKGARPLAAPRIALVAERHRTPSPPAVAAITAGREIATILVHTLHTYTLPSTPGGGDSLTIGRCIACMRPGLFLAAGILDAHLRRGDVSDCQDGNTCAR